MRVSNPGAMRVSNPGAMGPHPSRDAPGSGAYSLADLPGDGCECSRHAAGRSPRTFALRGKPDPTQSCVTSPLVHATRSWLAPLVLVAVCFAAVPAFAFAPSEPEAAPGIEAVQTYSPYVMAYDKLDVEDRQGYNSEYIFGMTKGIMQSTLVPALKPFFLLFTVPLDIAFLPFSAIAGFF
jgi:hypothetical protein